MFYLADPLGPAAGQAPYPYPATHSDGTAPEYAVKNEKDGIVEGKINVHLVPHTHDDTGWQVTVDQYFFTEVYYVVDTVVDQLVKNPKRHFIYVETGFCELPRLYMCCVSGCSTVASVSYLRRTTYNSVLQQSRAGGTSSLMTGEM